MQFENEIKKLCKFTYKLYHSTRVDYKIIVIIIIAMVDNFCVQLCSVSIEKGVEIGGSCEVK